MKFTFATRLYRRIIIKHFGNTKNFVAWVVAVAVTIYVIDSYILTRDHLQTLVDEEEKLDRPYSENNAGNRSVDDKTGRGSANNNNAPKSDEHLAKEDNEKIPDKPTPAPGVATIPCGLKEACPSGKFAFFVKSGLQQDISPTICFNDHYSVSPTKNNGQRGINMVIVNEETKEVEDIRHFDVYTDDALLIRYLKLGLSGHRVVLLATQDEASYHLTAEAKSWFNKLGSSIVDKMRFRDNWVMVGQRGLTRGSAIEKHQPKDKGSDFADYAEVSGCLSLPMGQLSEVEAPKESPANEPVKPAAAVAQGESVSRCGLTEDCDSTAFPVHIHSGLENKEGPKICVDGKYVMATGVNDAGRGFNVVVFNPKSREVIRVGHFDTYSEDSSNMEIFLEMMATGEIAVVVTHDDASRKLSEHAKRLLNDLGSGMIQNMKFRDVWAFVGQKGITGFGDAEQIEYSAPTTGWPKPIDMKVCIPVEMKGSKIKPDPMANKNEDRRKFCAKFDGYGEFCGAEHIDEPLTPAPLTDKSLENHAVFSVPVIVIPGLNHNAVRMQLETLLLNPGINPKMVTVMFDEKFSEPSGLAELFGFQSEKLSSSTKYIYQVEKALQKVWQLFPQAREVIVLEEEVIVGQDLLSFLAQTYPALNDSTLAGVSAWNDNGYEESSGSESLVYRAATFPGLGFLLKKSFYDKYMKDNMKNCCYKRSYDGWTVNGTTVEMVVPDKSRVFRRPYEGLSEQAEFLKALYNRPRKTHLTAGSKLSNVASLVSGQYERYVTEMLTASVALDTAYVDDCLHGNGLGFYIPNTPGKSYAVFYEQTSPSDYRILTALTKCFKAFNSPGHPPRGLHRGLLRLMYLDHPLSLVGSASPYYKQMPSNYKPIKVSQLPAS